MKTTNKLLIVMVLLVSLLSISAVSATDVNDTSIDEVDDSTVIDTPTTPDDTTDTPEIPVDDSKDENNTSETPTGNSTTEDNETNIPTEGDNETTESDNSLVAEDIEMFYKNGTRYEVVLTDGNGNPLANQTIIITIDGVDYEKVTDENGIASLAINLRAGTYTITSTFNETSINSTITILNTLEADNVIKYFKNGTHYYVLVVDGQGNPIANQTVTMNIDGVFYTKVTDENGIAKLSINLRPGEYIITTNGPNGAVISNKITVLPTLYGENVVKYFKNGTHYYVLVVDGQGNPIANQTVTMNIDGVFYTKVTDENGIAKLSINLRPGEYIITTNGPNGAVISNKITVLSTLIVEDMTKDYNKSANYTVKVLDDQGNPLANQTVTLNVNGVFYEKITDENGIARLAINLNPGKYIITASCNGAVSSSTITVNKLPASVKVTNTTVNKNGKLEVTVTSDGKPIVGQRVYFVYNDIAYYSISNENGVASIGIGLPEGKYTFMVGILDNMYYTNALVYTTVTVQ
ncbi:Ig-like domain-containing protein [Methanobrevibacter woesei]|uniref:Ig-like domain-containing protein n=1 Tax=Methanobrevibacter woesei TaxID=190976 RepID=UPI0026E0C5EB|nr:Ig-like domain-containing protein [Methanobrevibacter woesei]